VSTRRAFRRIKRGARYVRRRRKKTAALVIGGLGVLELLAWLTLRTTGVVITLLVLMLGTLAALAVSRTLFDEKPYGGNHRANRS
jgi:hypothetical protein